MSPGGDGPPPHEAPGGPRSPLEPLISAAEWHRSDDSWAMLRVVERMRPSDRKVRLFNAAACRRFWDCLPKASQAVLAESELLADGPSRGHSDDTDLCRRANGAIERLRPRQPESQFVSAEARIQYHAAKAVCYAVLSGDLWGTIASLRDLGGLLTPAERRFHAAIIRDIFGDPFHPPPTNPPWLGRSHDALLKLARSIYDNRDFDRLPDLANALEDAGCKNATVLEHCRQPGPHVRGCCVLDLVLGRT